MINCLDLTAEEFAVLERASQKHILVLVNDKEVLLRPFNVEKEHVHSDCWSCPDEMMMDDVNGKGCLVASRDVDSEIWRVHTMRPLLWGWLGYLGSDLRMLSVGGELLGNR
jgi:hypothetical protein